MYEIFDELIKQKGLSAYKVAKDTGISQTTLSDWKRGRSIPKTDKLQKIADYLGVTLDYLLGNEQKKNPHITCRSEMSIVEVGSQKVVKILC
jgi:transcriptional regulator with XRE-family HTH domain